MMNSMFKKLLKVLHFLVMIPVSCVWLVFVVEVPVWWLRILATLILIGCWYAPYDKTPLPKKKRPVTGIDFEHHCAELLMKQGFREVIVTPPSGDYGADLIAYDRQGNKWVFQCKHYKGKVSNSAVQEIAAAKAHYRANKAAVMTNSKLTEQARQLAIENEILLFEMLSD
jgi:HJR/Mrr/RecB family endonuclease